MQHHPGVKAVFIMKANESYFSGVMVFSALGCTCVRSFNAMRTGNNSNEECVWHRWRQGGKVSLSHSMRT